MDNLSDILNIIDKESLIYGVLSSVRKKEQDSFNKVSIKPVLIKNEFFIQFTYHYEKKVIHNNISLNDAKLELEKLIQEYFKQATIYTNEADYQILVSKKGKMKIIKKPPTRKNTDLSHDRAKKYIIPENEKSEFLIKLGVMNKDGRVYSKRYDKFKQINRYLEMVRDCIPYLDSDRTINIIDFGCGKSYLTFALYYYLVDKLGLSVNIVGLDLKKDVIEFCNSLAKELNYNSLEFKYGDIKEYEDKKNIDMVVSLHACDTATDEALAKSIKWGAKVILAVPCCQHELLKKIHNPVMNPMEKHGIVKEKLSSLVTDSLRGNVLEIMGYSVQMLEFIDMEHTPKNILIRAFKEPNNENSERAKQEYLAFKKFWGVEPYIEKAVGLDI